MLILVTNKLIGLIKDLGGNPLVGAHDGDPLLGGPSEGPLVGALYKGRSGGRPEKIMGKNVNWVLPRRSLGSTYDRFLVGGP